MRTISLAFLCLAAASIVMIMAAYYLVDASELLDERMDARSYVSAMAMQAFAGALTITILGLTYGLASKAQVKGRAITALGWFHFAVVSIQQISSSLATYYRYQFWASPDITPMAIMTFSTISNLLFLFSGLVFAAVLVLAMRAASRHPPTDVF